ncbi:MAG: hypothetical protein ABIH65_01215 [Nanoarchaeota archaeon]
MDINNSEIKSLEELTSEDCHILFDTSVIICPLGKNKEFFENRKEKAKADFLEKNNEFLNEMKEYILNKNNFFTTDSVIKELYSHHHYNYMKMIRRAGGHKDRELLRLRRMINKEQKEQRKIISAFTDNDKLIILEGEMGNIYDRIFEKYQKLIKENGLSYTDFDFLITGITLSMTSNPVIFVSNDYGIFHARNRILQKENLEEKDSRFFIRTNFFEFRSLYYCKHPKIEQLSGSS